MSNQPLPPDPPPFPKVPIPPELLEWARQTFDEAEFLAGKREIEETGGIPLADVIREIEERSGDRG